MNKFDETYYNMILEEAQIIKKSKVKSIIKAALDNKFRSIKSISNGYTFESLVVSPAIIKGNPQHNKKVDQFELTFDLTNDETLNLKLTYKFVSGDKTTEKTIKISDEGKLKSDVEKFVNSNVSTLRK